MKRTMVLVGLLGLSACALVTDLDGFSGNAATADGGGGSSSSGGADAGSSGGDAGDGGGTPDPDSGDAEGGVPAGEPLLVVAGGNSEAPFPTDSTDKTFYAPLRADGTLGAWSPGPTLPQPANMHTRVVASGGIVFALFGDKVVSTKKTASGGLDLFSNQPSYTFNDGFCAAASGASIFRMGGSISSTAVTEVVGTVTPAVEWKPATSLLAERQLHGCAASDQFVFQVGGKNKDGVHQNNVFVAARTGGALGPWSETAPLPKTNYWPRAVVVGSRVYVVGADWDEVPQKTIYTGAFDAQGKIAQWQTASPLPSNLGTPSVAVWGNRIIVAGGYDFATAKLTDKVITATVNAETGDLSSWTELTKLPMPLVNHGSAFAGP